MPRRPTPPLALILGPPAAGKTTIGVVVARSLAVGFRTIDDYVPVVYPSNQRQRAMLDSQVDAAVAFLLGNDRRWTICEFTHHDYLGLVAGDRYSFMRRTPTIFVMAGLDVCRRRNGARPRPVPDAYLVRAWHSSVDLLSAYSAAGGPLTLVVHTDGTSSAGASADTLMFVRDIAFNHHL